MSDSSGKLRISRQSPRQPDEPWLEFLRSKSTVATPQCYDEMTDVWVVGNSQGFQAFARALRRAETSAITTVFQLSDVSPHGMRVVVIPAERRPARARVRLWERVVSVKRQMKMELVVYGNMQGYRRLTNIVERVSNLRVDFDHEHVDWDDDWVVQRSISLNLRAPFRSREELVDQLGMADRNQNPNFLPPALEYMQSSNEPYETITPETARAHFPLVGKRFQTK